MKRWRLLEKKRFQDKAREKRIFSNSVQLLMIVSQRIENLNNRL